MIDNMSEVLRYEELTTMKVLRQTTATSRHVKTTWDWELRVTSASGSKDHPY